MEGKIEKVRARATHTPCRFRTLARKLADCVGIIKTLIAHRPLPPSPPPSLCSRRSARLWLSGTRRASSRCCRRRRRATRRSCSGWWSCSGHWRPRRCVVLGCSSPTMTASANSAWKCPLLPPHTSPAGAHSYLAHPAIYPLSAAGRAAQRQRGGARRLRGGRVRHRHRR